MKKRTLYIVGGVIAGIFLINQLFPTPNRAEAEEAKKRNDSLKVAEAAAKKLDEDLLSALVLSEQYLKKSLKDPDSYQEIEHKKYRVSPKVDRTHYQVIIKYRAKNSFGGYVVNQRTFDFDSTVALFNTFEGP